MARSDIQLQLLPHEIEALRRWDRTPTVQKQLPSCSREPGLATLKLSRLDLQWLASDLNHAIVKRECRDQDVFELSERLEHVLETGDGSLEAWY